MIIINVYKHIKNSPLIGTQTLSRYTDFDFRYLTTISTQIM